MIKLVLFDCDGPIIRPTKYFSQRLEELRGIITDTKDEKSFFTNEFLRCEAGQADLKEELEKKLDIWGWKGTAGELMEFWFSGEAEADSRMIGYINRMRRQGIKAFLSTNNEKYRVDYLWEKAGLKNFLDGKYASAAIGYLKPQSQFWEEIYKDFPTIPKESILVWDDAQPSVDSAREFGFQAEFYKTFEGFEVTMKDYISLEEQL